MLRSVCPTSTLAAPVEEGPRSGEDAAHSSNSDAAAFERLENKVSALRSTGMNITLDRSPLNGCSPVFIDAVRARIACSLASAPRKDPAVQTYIAYGPSGTGKSRTIGATVDCLLSILFDMLKAGSQFQIRIAAYEEHLKAGLVSDLLDINKATGKPTARAFSTSTARGHAFHIRDLQTVPVSDLSQATKTLQLARKRLCKMATRNNKDSSRAHSCIEIVGRSLCEKSLLVSGSPASPALPPRRTALLSASLVGLS